MLWHLAFYLLQNNKENKEIEDFMDFDFMDFISNHTNKAFYSIAYFEWRTIYNKILLTTPSLNKEQMIALLENQHPDFYDESDFDKKNFIEQYSQKQNEVRSMLDDFLKQKQESLEKTMAHRE